MLIYKTKWFNKWASKEGLTDRALSAAVAEMSQGLIDAELGSHLFKKRAPIGGKGKNSGVRTLLAFKLHDKAFFLYGFAKNQRENISNKELLALKKLSETMIEYQEHDIAVALSKGSIIEVQQYE